MAMLKGRDRLVVRLLEQAGMDIELYIHEFQTRICSELGDKEATSKCYIVKNGGLVESEYGPRGSCGSSMYAASKSKKKDTAWLTEQFLLGKLEKKYGLLAECEMVQYHTPMEVLTGAAGIEPVSSL